MERVSEAFGLLAFFIALLFFLAEAPAAVYSWQYIASTDPSLYIIIPFPTDPFTVSLVVALCVALLLLFLLSNFMPGRMKVRSFDGPAQSSFYSVFAAFVLLQLVVSVIIRFDDPPSLGYSPIDGFITPPAQVFYDASTTLVETLLLQAVPVTVIMVVYALARREKVSEALLNPRLSFWGRHRPLLHSSTGTGILFVPGGVLGTPGGVHNVPDTRLHIPEVRDDQVLRR
ncbi:hypothetical protein [Thermogymnomonas acidicola]|uniref:hypothetical protein n=1 Tax=Thermogymnomonas acidicola TaxID=399579 RepID=UPI0009468874|nr:hypothetical protein [Thermogymnomonas acidicola]